MFCFCFYFCVGLCVALDCVMFVLDCVLFSTLKREKPDLATRDDLPVKRIGSDDTA